MGYDLLAEPSERPRFNEQAIAWRGENAPPDSPDDPERAAAQAMIMAEFRRFVDEGLTERQRRASLAAMGDMPLEAVADRAGTNRNALYKVLHDARKRLKRRWKPRASACTTYSARSPEVRSDRHDASIRA